MDAAIALSLVAGVGWAVNIVTVRWALDRTGAPPMAGALVAIGIAAGVAIIAAVVTGAEVPGWDSVWRFALVGAIAPGSSQGLFVSSIGRIGPARSSVLVSTNPIWSVALAILFLGEGWEVAVIVGTLLVVVGGVLISWEPGLGFRHIGVVLALGTAVTFGVRDVIAREFTSESDVSIWWASSIVFVAATLVVLVMSAGRLRGSLMAGVRRASPSFLASGLAIGIALPMLFFAFDRGEVGLVAPLSNASQSVMVVALGAAVFGARERTPRILLALVLVVAGGALITAT